MRTTRERPGECPAEALATLSNVTIPASARVRPRLARRLAVAVAGVLVTASCAAGQHAQTADVVPSIDGTHGQIGNMLLEGVAIHAPDGPSYAAGSNAQLAITLVNNGSAPDKLTNVSSSAFAGWGIVANADATSVTQTTKADTGLTIDAHSAQRLGLADLGASADMSPRTLVLTNLAKSLYPGVAVDVTFSFANAGAVTLHVPVQLTAAPNTASLPAPTGPSID